MSGCVDVRGLSPASRVRASRENCQRATSALTSASPSSIEVSESAAIQALQLAASHD
jgi:hypothetical protein